MMSHNWYAIILAGGSGSRMHAGCNKILLKLAGVPVIVRSVRAFRQINCGIVLVTRPEEREAIRNLLEQSGIRSEALLWADGGSDRQQSVWNGLQCLPEDCDMVMIHDGARCMVSEAVIRSCMTDAEKTGSGIASVPVTDTIKQLSLDRDTVTTPDRSLLRAVQTPQAFRRQLILQAHENARADDFHGTDDASLLEYMELSPTLSEGSRSNLKITTPEDLMIAESLLMPSVQNRIGFGYDVHRLVENRRLILCGIEIPHTLGLLGHSDADVALHALMDAMLGAAALGDIGRHFPDTDARYKGISSLSLLRETCRILAEHGCTVINCDITIAAQKPKLMPYIPAMRDSIAAVLGIPAQQVSVKATTTERLGFEGREEGISAQAVCMIRQEIS